MTSSYHGAGQVWCKSIKGPPISGASQQVPKSYILPEGQYLSEARKAPRKREIQILGETSHVDKATGLRPRFGCYLFSPHLGSSSCISPVARGLNGYASAEVLQQMVTVCHLHKPERHRIGCIGSQDAAVCIRFGGLMNFI